MIYKQILVPRYINTKEVTKKQEERYVNYRLGDYEYDKMYVSVVPFSISYDDLEHDKLAGWYASLPFTHAVHINTEYVDVYSFWFQMKVFGDYLMKKAGERKMSYYYCIEWGRQTGHMHLHGLIRTKANQLDIMNAWREVQKPSWDRWRIRIEDLSVVDNRHSICKYICKSDLGYRQIDNQIEQRGGLSDITEYWQHLVKQNIKFKGRKP
jgi:hypothetical protein